MKNEKGFTLIEMLIVVLVISILLLITIPNITAHHQNIQGKGCEGLINMVQAQVEAYKMEMGVNSVTLGELEDAGYIKEAEPKCPNGNVITLTEGVVGDISPSDTE